MNSKINEPTKTAAKKSLPVKYNQLLVFGYWFLNHQKSNGKITSEVYDEYLSAFHVFDGIESQMEYFNDFFGEFKSIHKNLKNDIRAKNKKPKAKKKKEIDPNEPPKKRGRKRKEVVDNRTEDQKLIDQIIASAQSEFAPEEKNQTDVKTIEPEKKKKCGRPRKVRQIISVCANDDLIGALIAQSQRESSLNENSYEDSDSDEEIEVRKFINNDILYLIDDNNNIYDHQSHDLIGIWNDVSQKVDIVENDSDDEESDREIESQKNTELSELSHERYT